MLNPGVGLPGKYPQHAAPVPAVRKAWVRGQSSVHQRNRRLDVLAGIAEYEGCACENKGVVACRPNGPASVIETPTPNGVRRVGHTVRKELLGAHRRESE